MLEKDGVGFRILCNIGWFRLMVMIVVCLIV